MDAGIIFIATLVVSAIAIVWWNKIRKPHASHKWVAGPIIKGNTYSRNVDINQLSNDLCSFKLNTTSEIDYLTYGRHDKLGNKTLRVKYTITGDEGVKFIPTEYPEREAIVSISFQRRGDNWSAAGEYQFYRWYSRLVLPINVGETEFAISFDPANWFAVMGHEAAEYNAEYQAAMNDIDSISIVFGSSGGRGHGVRSSANAEFTLTQFTIS